MTRYEQGFMNKCAEHGLSTGAAIVLMQKQAKLSQKGVFTLLNKFKTFKNLKGFDNMADRSRRAKLLLKRLGTLTPEVEENLDQIGHTAVSGKSVMAPYGAQLDEMKNFMPQLRKALISTDPGPAAYIYGTLGFKPKIPIQI